MEPKAVCVNIRASEPVLLMYFKAPNIIQRKEMSPGFEGIGPLPYVAELSLG